jgi:glycolate oxidase
MPIETLAAQLRDALSDRDVLVGEHIKEDYTHDECLNLHGTRPALVVRPASTEQVAIVMRLAQEHRMPVTVRGAGSGLSGACIPSDGGLVLSTERMKRVLEIDAANHVAVVEPGVTLGELDEATAQHGLCYPIQPGEAGATLGGNVATNAGGMRAVKYGVTRHQVLGLQAVLPGGEVIECGGKFVKASSGYDLAQLIVGSEGTLAVVTRIILKLVPRLTQRATMLVPFENLEQITKAVPKLVQSGIGPLFVEYLDALSMAGVLMRQQIDLGIPEAIKSKALAYLLIALESASETRNAEDVEALGQLSLDAGAMDVYVLSKNHAGKVIKGREESFWTGKQAGLNDQVDVVVPRAKLSEFMQRVQEKASETQTLIVGAGHAGDGNVHLGIFQPDEALRTKVMDAIFDLGAAMGGIVSAEHGIGLAKKKYYVAREDPAKLALMRRIKQAFDPYGIMNPGKVFDLA